MSGEAEREHLESLVHEFDKVPVMLVSDDDFWAISKALRGYSGYILSGGKLSPEQKNLVVRIGMVQGKLNRNIQQVRTGRAVTDGLEFEDIEVMSDALVGFIHAISRRVPKSPQRDEILARLRFLWQQLEKLLDEMVTGAQE